MVIYEKIYFEAYIYVKNTFVSKLIGTITFSIRERRPKSMLEFFSSLLKDTPNILWFPPVHVVKTHFLLENDINCIFTVLF